VIVELETTPMPGRIRALPRTKVGYPVPYFAATVGGVRDFRVGDPDAFVACTSGRACWICGQRRRRREAAFTIGPMCCVNRVTPDPPSHVECAEYAAKACPFMARPSMVRRDRGLPENVGSAGVSITRNPGVCLIWVTGEWSTFRTPHGGQGVLFQLGEPAAVSWWAHGRPAIRAEILDSIESGLPLLDAQCDLDADPVESRRVLARCYERALRYLPAA
jgi:hypothetical protein